MATFLVGAPGRKALKFTAMRKTLGEKILGWKLSSRHVKSETASGHPSAHVGCVRLRLKSARE